MGCQGPEREPRQKDCKAFTYASVLSGRKPLQIIRVDRPQIPNPEAFENPVLNPKQVRDSQAMFEGT